MLLATSELKAQDVMTSDPICVSPHTTIRELARIFEDNEISGTPVVDQEGTVIGLVSKTDLIRQCSEGTDEIPPAYLFEVLSEQGDEGAGEVMPEPTICVQDFMTEDPLMVARDHPVKSIARLMCEHRIHRVVVADEKKYPVGIITSLDVLEALAR